MSIYHKYSLCLTSCRHLKSAWSVASKLHLPRMKTNLLDWNWWVGEGAIENAVSNPQVCCLWVVYAIPANVLWWMMTWITINCSIDCSLLPAINMVSIVATTAEIHWINKTCMLPFCYYDWICPVLHTKILNVINQVTLILCIANKSIFNRVYINISEGSIGKLQP